MPNVSFNASSTWWLKQCITWSHGDCCFSNAPSPRCIPVFTLAPSTFNPVSFSAKDVKPILEKASSIIALIPSASPDFTHSMLKNFNVGVLSFKNKTYTSSCSTTLASVLPSFRHEKNLAFARSLVRLSLDTSAMHSVNTEHCH